MTSPTDHVGIARDVATFAAAFDVTVARNADEVAWSGPGEDLTWARVEELVDRLAGGLQAMGVGKGDVVALHLSNRPELSIADLAVMTVGATSLLMHPALSAGQIAELVQRADVVHAFTEKRFGPTWTEAKTMLSRPLGLTSVDGDGHGGVPAWDELLVEPAMDGRRARSDIRPQDILMLIATSGTTGAPKLVELTHGAKVSACRAFAEAVRFPRRMRLLSWLPNAHFGNHHLPIALGMEIWTCREPADVEQALKAAEPTWFFAPPATWRVLCQRIVERLGTQNLAAASRQDRERVRADLGLGRLYTAHAVAAPSPPELLRSLRTAGVPVAELYGMSETAGAGCVNPPGRVRVGTVGPPSPSCEIDLAPDGEIIIRAPFIMRGYRGDPEQTQAVLRADGGYRTGDLGRFDHEGYLIIVGRKKDVLVSADGRTMSPDAIEAVLKNALPEADHVVVFGEGRPYNVALIVISGESCARCTPRRVTDACARANERLAGYEHIARFATVHEVWTANSGHLTNTGKIRRDAVGRRYGRLLDSLYG